MASDLYDKLTRDLLQGRENGTNYQTLKTALWRAVKSDPDRHLEMFFANWFNHNWARPLEALVGSRRAPRAAKAPPTVAELKAKRKDDANLRGLALMNIFLSDGETRLKDATGKQVRQELGWFQVIAKHVKPNEIVGRKLTAQQLFNLREQTDDIALPPRSRAA